MAPATSSEPLCGAAREAIPNSQAEPIPIVASRKGKPQQEATPNAAAKPLKVSKVAPVSRRGRAAVAGLGSFKFGGMRVIS
ncbi:hypothetical protein MXAZACID_17246 [Acidocella sp. MX-AZ02]|nr:hypothetical protein MXAZACID_17246 [Acidocella sp. MX-AZ02]